MHIKKLWYKNGNDLYVGSSIDYTYTERERIPQKWVHNFQIACLGLVVATDKRTKQEEMEFLLKMTLMMN